MSRQNSAPRCCRSRANWTMPKCLPPNRPQRSQAPHFRQAAEPKRREWHPSIATRHKGVESNGIVSMSCFWECLSRSEFRNGCPQDTPCLLGEGQKKGALAFQGRPLLAARPSFDYCFVMRKVETRSFARRTTLYMPEVRPLRSIMVRCSPADSVPS